MNAHENKPAGAATKPVLAEGPLPPGGAVEASERSTAEPRAARRAGRSPRGRTEARAVREVWLPGNARPVVAAALAIGMVVTVLGIVEGTIRSGLPTASLCLACAAIAAIGTLAVTAARPRLERRGGVLRVRLMPLLPQDVPLEVVECFFFGIVPLGRSVEPCSGSGSDQPEPAADAARASDVAAGRGGPRADQPAADAGVHAEGGSGARRATLIMRLAEREKEWRSRPSLAAWGIWRHGAIAFDGLWCARLSPDVAADLTRRLVVARRELASLAAAGAVGESAG